MTQEARALIEILRDETQSREVFDRCNAVLAAPSSIVRTSAHGIRPNSILRFTFNPWTGKDGDCVAAIVSETADELVIGEIHATEAEVEIITGERK